MGSTFLRTVSAAIGRTPIGKQLIAEARKEASARRKAAFAELCKAREAGAAAESPLRKAEEQAGAKAKAAAEAHAAALLQLSAATFARRGAIHACEQRVAALERELVALAPPEINKFLDYLAALFEGLRVAPGIDHDRAVAIAQLTFDARKRAEELRRSGGSDEEITAELQELRHEITKACKGLGMSRDVALAAQFEAVPGPEAA